MKQLIALSMLATLSAGSSVPAQPTPVAQDLARIRDEALRSDWAWKQLERLTDTAGPRLSGSRGLQAAIEQVSEAARASGARVTLQAVKVPQWVRGREEAELVEFPGRPAGITQAVHLTALGGSAATPAAGLTAPVLVVRDLEDLRARGQEARNKIVVITSRFDQRLAENGRALQAYLQGGAGRFGGPKLGQSLGAAAVLVRSVGGADYRLPHTGATNWAEGQPHLPAAALAAEDAALIERLAHSGPVTLRLVLTPRTLPDAESYNIVADWRGSELPEEVVVVSGHLDSWDLGTGAIDDGAGVISAAAVLHILKTLDLHPRRTIRFIAWTNEENGDRGGRAYVDSVANNIASQFAAIESDLGAGKVLGIDAAVTSESLAQFEPLMQALAPIGATVLSRIDSEAGSDIAGLQQLGVPGFAPSVDARHYFDYHHTAADTLDKVDPAMLREQVATLAALAYHLAQMPGPLPRLKIAE
jgi:hypothetical protein